jgi:hypothetical protein
MCDQIHKLSPAYQALDGFDWQQGFIDQYGVFMDRRESLEVATAAGQINVRRTKTNPVNQLFSEDIY